MLIFRTVQDIQSWLTFYSAKGSSIGFVPTMGALHAGHISLIDRAKRENHLTVCSIFVNPTQFNDAKDLEKYPRTLESDSLLLSNAGCDVLFYPSVAEIYPPGLAQVKVDLKGLDLVMEGAHRPGHFEGVVQVVHRLLDIVRPDRLYMGEKDFQQFTIIGHMIKELNLPVQLVVCPISREPHGLAMSSRNERLSTEGRKQAAFIYSTLSKAIDLKNTMKPEQICLQLFDELNQDPFKPEYVDIVGADDLLPIKTWTDSPVVICTAVWLEGIRLIDNIILSLAAKE